MTSVVNSIAFSSGIKIMKRIINPLIVRSVVPLALAAMPVTFLTSTLPKITSVSAAPAMEAKAGSPFKDEAVRDTGVKEALPGLPFMNPNGPLSPGVISPDKNETPGTMMAVGKEGLDVAKSQAVALNDVTALMSRLSTDKAYAAKLLEAIKKEDSKAAAAVLKETVMRSDITVNNMKSDFHLDFQIHFNSYTGTACFSSDHSCSGHNVTLG